MPGSPIEVKSMERGVDALPQCACGKIRGRLHLTEKPDYRGTPPPLHPGSSTRPGGRPGPLQRPGPHIDGRP